MQEPRPPLEETKTEDRGDVAQRALASRSKLAPATATRPGRRAATMGRSVIHTCAKPMRRPRPDLRPLAMGAIHCSP
jgi:hypothetical protein